MAHRDAPSPQTVFDFRRIHHYHILPGPPRLLAWEDPSRTGDHTAVSRLIAPLGLCLSQLARVLSLNPAHYALGGALGIAWGFGLRQSIHSLMLGRRNLQRLGQQRDQLQAGMQAHGRATHTDALHARLVNLQNQARYGLALDAVGGVGSAMLGIAYLFRAPLLGGAVHSLAHITLPMLHFGVVPPLLAPIAVACLERTGRAIYTRHRLRRMHAYLKRVTHRDAPFVDALYRARQNELGKYFAVDAASRGVAVAGACITIFVGPVGLLILVPSLLGTVVTTCFARRMLRVDDAMTPHEKMSLDTDGRFIDTIVTAHRSLGILADLRQLRRERYPAGWGTRFRPLLRIYRHLRYQTGAHAATSAQVLAAFGRGEQRIKHVRAPDPLRVLEILDAGRVRAQFAKAMMKDKPMRSSLRGHGVTMVGKKWSIDTEAVAMRLCEAQWHGDPDHVAGRMYELAEEVLLTKGLTEGWRHQRALLDGYGRFAKARLRADVAGSS